MIVVSDTTPLNYLVLIDAIDVLPSTYRIRPALLDAALSRDAERKRLGFDPDTRP